MNWHKLDKLYDLEHGEATSVGLRDLCKRFVQSYVLTPVHNEEHGLEQVFVASEHERGMRLCCVPAETIVGIFERIGNDYPSEWHGHFNGKEWIISQR